MFDFKKIIGYLEFLWRRKNGRVISLGRSKEGRERAEEHWVMIVAMFFVVVFAGGIFDIYLANNIRKFAERTAGDGDQKQIEVVDREVIKKASEILDSREKEAQNRFLLPVPDSLNR